MKYNNGSLEYVFNSQSDTVNNPMPILQQQKANLTTNPFIKSVQQIEPTIEIDVKPTQKINTQLSIAAIGFMDDCFNKPDDIEWKHYAPIILHKENRFTYIFILVLFIFLFVLLMLL
jgi:hypothetical protein